MNKFLTAVIASLLTLAPSVQADDQPTGKKTHQQEREAAPEAQPAASARGAPGTNVPATVNPRAPRRAQPASVQQQRRAPRRPDNSGIQNQTDAPVPVVTNEPAPAPPRAHHRDRQGAAAPGEKPDVQNIRARHTHFRAQPRPQEIPPVTFDENRRIRGSEHWQGDKYSAFRSYHPHRHDRDWYHKHCPRIIFICGGYYFWDNFYWYPAWGYDALASYYPYDGPIYSGPLAEPPDQLIADVQAALQELGYYDGEVDGILGPATQEVLGDYQADNGLYETSAIDQPTLDSLGLG